MSEQLITLVEVVPSYTSHNIYFYAQGVSFCMGVTLDKIESIELQLTEIVSKLYAYRKEHGNE